MYINKDTFWFLTKMLLSVGAVFLLTFRLGQTTLTNWDEAWFASVARDGNWNGENWFYEPPLVTNLLQMIMQLFGASEFWLRLPFALFGLGIVWLTYKWGGLLSSLILLADIEFLFRARQINTDTPLTFLLLLTLYSFWQNKPQIGWVAWGLAFLTKRATPLLLLPTLALFLWKKKQWAGFWLFLLIVGSWHGYMWWKFGSEFINKYIFGFTIGKIVSINPAVGSNYYFYFLALKHAFKLFIFALPVALIWAIKQGKKWWVILTVIMTFFGLMTLAPIKASWYLLPIHPLVAITIGSFLAKLAGKRVWTFGLVIFLVGFQLVRWRSEYLVPETTRHQAEIARLAGKLVSDKIYLDDDYLPVAVWYSGKQVMPLRFNRLPMTRTNLSIPADSFVLTNKTNLPELSVFLSYQEVMGTGDLLLLKTLPLPENE